MNDPMTYANPETIERILRETHTWAVVGASANPDRASNDISRVLLDQGYSMIPINPREDEIHGQTVYRDLASAAEAAPTSRQSAERGASRFMGSPPAREYLYVACRGSHSRQMKAVTAT